MSIEAVTLICILRFFVWNEVQTWRPASIGKLHLLVNKSLYRLAASRCKDTPLLFIFLNLYALWETVRQMFFLLCILFVPVQSSL